MKIVLLTIVVLLFMSRIKNTPSMLSKKLYRLKMQKNIDGRSDNQTKYDDRTLQGVAICLAILLHVLLFIFYIIVGCTIGTTEMYILSAVQAATVVKSAGMIFGDGTKLFSNKVEDYPFHRVWFLFNVVLDYMYYPLAMYLLK